MKFLEKSLAEGKSKRSFRDFLLPPVRLARSRTPGFHPGNRGSNPLREAIFIQPSRSPLEGFLMPTFPKNKGMKNPGVTEGLLNIHMLEQLHLGRLTS